MLLWFSLLVPYDSLWPHGQQHAWLPCPLPFPRVCSNSCPLSWWCHPTISFSVAPFASCLQSFTKSGSFPVSRLFTSGGQSITASASDQSFQWIFRTISFRIDWLDLYSPRDSQKSSPTPHFKSINSLALSFLYIQLLHPYMTTGKAIALTRWMCLSNVCLSIYLPISI